MNGLISHKLILEAGENLETDLMIHILANAKRHESSFRQFSDSKLIAIVIKVIRLETFALMDAISFTMNLAEYFSYNIIGSRMLILTSKYWGKLWTKKPVTFAIVDNVVQRYTATFPGMEETFLFLFQSHLACLVLNSVSDGCLIQKHRSSK